MIYKDIQGTKNLTTKNMSKY